MDKISYSILSESQDRIKANKYKNSNQICDEIYVRQYERLKQDYFNKKLQNITAQNQNYRELSPIKEQFDNVVKRV